MSRQVVLHYDSPTWVTVDLDQGKVVKVEVGDEETTIQREDDGTPCVVDAFAEATGEECREAAAIAEGDGMWPEWRFGS